MDKIRKPEALASGFLILKVKVGTLVSILSYDKLTEKP